MKRPHIVFYDVLDDEDRASVRAALRPVADRIQQSVWAIPPNGYHPHQVVGALSDLLREGDRLLVVAPCADCHAAARSLTNGDDRLGWPDLRVVP